MGLAILGMIDGGKPRNEANTVLHQRKRGLWLNTAVVENNGGLEKELWHQMCYDH